MKKKTSSTKIPVMNYVKLFFLVLVTIFIILLLRNWYINNRNYELSIPIIEETLKSQIHGDEVYNYVRENENAVLYIGVANDENCRSFEKDFNSVIRKRGLGDTIMYLNITKTKDKNGFIQDFNKFYDTDLLGYPSIVVFEEGKIKATITVKVGDPLQIEDVILFLDRNGVVSSSL